VIAILAVGFLLTYILSYKRMVKVNTNTRFRCKVNNVRFDLISDEGKYVFLYRTDVGIKVKVSKEDFKKDWVIL
jgi:hypothetical protein